MVVRRLSSSNTASELYHHGVKGQKWGVRRYQNPDGSLKNKKKIKKNKNIDSKRVANEKLNKTLLNEHIRISLENSRNAIEESLRQIRDLTIQEIQQQQQAMQNQTTFNQQQLMFQQQQQQAMFNQFNHF